MDQDIVEGLYDEAWITDVLYEVKSGKEATVYCCRAHPRTETNLLALKVYRQQNHRTFSNDAAYRDGEYIGRSRDRRALKNKSSYGRVVQQNTWISREWSTMKALYAAGADIPRPIHEVEGAVLMEYLGDEDGPAKRLNEVHIPKEEAEGHLDRLLANVRLWLAHNYVHGDLSPYNILHWNGALTVIDFPQACDPRFNANAREFLTRDIAMVCRRFETYGVRYDAQAFADAMWEDFENARL